jgi:hypothetical protein
MRLIYDTHDGWKCRLLKFHANGEWTRMDPFDRPLSLLIPLPAVGTLEFEFPVAQFDRAWAAFAAIPADDRMPEAAQARDDALMEFVRPAIGTFVRESNNRPYWIRWDRRLGLMKGGREWRGEFSMMRYDWSATDFQGERQIRLDKQALRIATDGSRMMLADVGNDDGETWLRTEIAAAGEAVKPTANRDLTGLWRHPELDSPVCAILHRPDGRIVLIDAEDKRTYAALNSRNELFAAESGEWATAARGTVDLQFQVLTWMNSDGSSSRWTRSADAAGTLMGIWHRKSNTGSRDRRCIITERARGESGTTCLLIDEWDRRTSAEFANGVLKVKSGPEWGPKHGKASTNGQRIEWDSGVVWER